MDAGIRFTCLKNGDPLLGQTWEYKNMHGVEAIEQKLEDMFYFANKLKFKYVIDSIKLSMDASRQIYIVNSGINGDIWPFEDRMNLYKYYSKVYDVELVIELDYPTVINETNINLYAQQTLLIMKKYSFINYWQITVNPESYDSAGMMYCPPHLYSRLMKLIYKQAHLINENIKIGGPGILEAISEYTSSESTNIDGDIYHSGWLSEATGEAYGADSKYDEGGPEGFLDSIDFFAFQGRQDFSELNYNKYPEVIKKLKQGIIAQAQKSNITLDIPWFSTYQGHYAMINNATDLQLQAFRDLREFSNAFSSGVVPFKAQLVDEFFDENSITQEQNPNYYGIMYYYLGNTRKPAYDQYLFFMDTLKEFTKLPLNTISVKKRKPYEDSDNVEHVMLLSEDGKKMCTIIYPRFERTINNPRASYVKISLKANSARTCYVPGSSPVKLISATDIEFRNFDFCIVVEDLDLEIIIDDDFENKIKRKLKFYQQVASDYMSVIPSTYNHEVYDTNFYKLLRSLATETGDARYIEGILEDNIYLSTVHGDAIYNNFGCMVGVEWQTRWNENEYRDIISAIFESLLSGATKKSIQKVIGAFTKLDVTVYEMFKDYKHFGLEQDQNWDNQYRFAVEIEKSLGDDSDIDEMYKDTKFITDIVKPAHTIPVIIFVFVGKENYKDWYNERFGGEFSKSDKVKEIIDYTITGNEYGWKSHNYGFAFKPTSETELNGPVPIGAKYTLHDRTWQEMIINENEIYDKAKDDWYVHFKGNNEEVYDKDPEDELTDIDIYNTLTEAKFGYTVKDAFRPGTTDFASTLVNRWAVGYKLEDKDKEFIDWTIEEDKFEVKDEEHTISIEDVNSETYEKPEEEHQFGIVNHLKEIAYRWRIDDKSFKSNERTTLNHKWPVTDRLDEKMSLELTPAYTEAYTPKNDSFGIGSVESTFSDTYKVKRERRSISINNKFEEEFRKPDESVSIMLYEENSDGTKNILEVI